MVKQTIIKNDYVCKKNAAYIINLISDYIINNILSKYNYKNLVESGKIKSLKDNKTSINVKRAKITGTGEIDIFVDTENLVPMSLTFFNNVKENATDINIVPHNSNNLHGRVLFHENIYTLYFSDIKQFTDIFDPFQLNNNYEYFYPNLDIDFLDDSKMSIDSINSNKIGTIKFKDKIDKLHIFDLKSNNQNIFKYSFIALPDFYTKYSINDLKKILELVTYKDQFNRHLFNLASKSLIHLLEIENLREITFTLKHYKKDHQHRKFIDIVIDFDADNVILRRPSINKSTSNFITVINNKIVANVFKDEKLSGFDSMICNHYFSFLNFSIYPAVMINKIPFNMCPIFILQLYSRDNILNKLSNVHVRKLINECLITYIVTTDNSAHLIKNEIVKKFKSLDGKSAYVDSVLSGANISRSKIVKLIIQRLHEMIQDTEFLNKIMSMLTNLYKWRISSIISEHMLKMATVSTEVINENNDEIGKLIKLYPIIYTPVLR